jgi:hypothetical protein
VSACAICQPAKTSPNASVQRLRRRAVIRCLVG